MVQKYQSPVRVYKQPFELVMAVSVLSSPFTNCVLSTSLLFAIVLPIQPICQNIDGLNLDNSFI